MRSLDDGRLEVLEPGSRRTIEGNRGPANAYGGAVAVGVDETDDYPKRARGPDPVLIPRVAACAEQMQQALDSRIDPPLAVLEVRGIEQPGGDGHGVLVIRTGASTRAPHGHGRPPLVDMRRGSGSEKI